MRLLPSGCQMDRVILFAVFRNRVGEEAAMEVLAPEPAPIPVKERGDPVFRRAVRPEQPVELHRKQGGAMLQHRDDQVVL
jgi:hypothetical protein